MTYPDVQVSNAEDKQFADKIAALGLKFTGETFEVTEIRRLTGGANMESWWIDYGPHQWVMRRMPQGMKGPTDDSAGDATGVDIDIEADIIATAIQAGVTAPEIIGTLTEADDLGLGFVMQRIVGEALPHKIFKLPSFSNAISRLPEQCAAELAKIHAISPESLPSQIPQELAPDVIARLAQRYARFKARIPSFELAFHWLKNNLPEPRPLALVHGDFRMGNLMIDGDGIAAVLDWEQAHFGDPAQDLGYLCTPSWRFGNYEEIVGGFGSLDELLSHYRRLSGLDIPLKDINFWMIVSSLIWGLGTLNMINLWRSGEDSSLERAVVGRRTSETEIDLLLMLEDAIGLNQNPVQWSAPDRIKATGQTHLTELLTALINWDEQHVFPSVEGRDLFQARVARNALNIALRETTCRPLFEQARKARLDGLGFNHDTLCTALANGVLDDEMLICIRLDLLERVHIDQPKYAGFKAALNKWTR